MQKIYTASVNLTNNTYENCQTIIQVDLMQTPWVNNSMVDAFNNCSNLHTVTNINSQVNSLANAFKNCQNLVNAPAIPPNVTNMYETFRWCSNLAEIPTLPNTRLDLAGTFYHCHALTTPPTLPDDVSNLNGAFIACYNLVTTPTIPNSVGSSLNSTFYECTGLTTHTPLPDSATLLHSTFVGCSGLTSIPAFSTNVRNLYETYYGCSNLTTIPNIPSNVTDMYHTFGACVNISGDINILSDKVVNVTNLFGETSARKNVYIPPVQYNNTSINSPTYNSFIAAGYDELGTKDGVYLMYNYAPALPSDWITSTAANGTTVLEQYIGTNTTVVTPHNDWYSNKVLNVSTMVYPNYIGPFSENPAIVNVDLCNIEVINNNFAYGFVSCQNLQSVTNINSSITNMSRTFAGCPNLVISPSLPPNVTNLTETYLVSYNLQTAPSIPQTVDDMYRTFWGCQSLSTIPTIPDSVTNTYGTFYGIFNLTNANFIANGTLNTAFAFESCVNLQTINVNIPKATNAAHMLGYCTNLTDINIIAPNVTVITNIFTNCTNLTNVYAEFNSVTNLNLLLAECYTLENCNLISTNCTTLENTFRNCNHLTNINWFIPNVTNLRQTFDSCTLLTDSPIIPNSVTSMHSTFVRCSHLVNIPTLPNSIESMAFTFSYCTRLVNAPEIPNSVAYLAGTFHSCTNLAIAPNIPENYTNALQQVFSNCTALTTVYSLGKTSSLLDTFTGCSSLINIPTIPNTVTDMRRTFERCTNLTGNIYIQSNRVSHAEDCFNRTSLPKYVYIPFEYENGVNTVTRNSFEAEYPINTISGTVQGTLTNNDGVISGFSESNYLWVETTPPTPITAIEEVIKIHTNSITPSDPTYDKQCIVAGEPYVGIASIHIYNDGRLQIYISSNDNVPAGSGNDIAPGVLSTLTVNANTDYWIKFTWDGTTYKLSVSTDGTNYTDYIVINNSLPPAFNGKLSYGTDTGASYTRPFLGTIDLRNSYVKINGQNLWNGYVRPNGVVLKDIDGSRIVINPNPADATVLMFNETAGTEIEDTVLNKFSYININGNVEIQGLNTNDTAIVVPSQWVETNRMRAPEGSIIHYRVYKDSYYPVEGQVTVDGSQTIDVNLEQIMCTYTVVPMPPDATVTLTSDAEIQLCAYTSSSGYGTIYLNPNDSSDDQLYNSKGQPYSAGDVIEGTSNTLDQATVYMWQSHPRIYVNNGTLTICSVDPEKNIGVQRTIIRGGGYSPSFAEFENSIVVPWGTEVSYTVSKAHYTTVTGTEIVKTTGSKFVPLAIDQHTFTINATPNDATVQILVNGRLANASNSDWVFTANNANGDIELQEYIGSNTVVVMPTSYETTNTVTANYGSTIEWKVSKEHYRTQTDILTLTEDTTLTIALEETERRLDVTDYTYTNENNIVTLTGYIGNGGDIDTPEIEEV